MNVQQNYHVLLPDGRKQTVTYTVDGYGGYVADVKYEGEVQYPEHHQPSYHEPISITTEFIVHFLYLSSTSK